jgi:AraC family transcriptional regulator
MELAVQQFISEMWERHIEPVNLGDLASSVFVSPFHFLRVFTRSTGVTPGKYLSAIRMYEAKRLLLTTSLRVSDIVNEVGYRSLGSFTTRFTQAVGMTPGQYRESAVSDLLVAVGPRFSRFPPSSALRDREVPPAPDPSAVSVTGTVELPPEAALADIVICVFREPVPQGAPVAFAFLPAAGSSRFAVPDVPVGRHVVIAVAAPKSEVDLPVLLATGAVPVTPGGGSVRLRLRAPRPTDPPLAISLAARPAAAEDRTIVLPAA